MPVAFQRPGRSLRSRPRGRPFRRRAGGARRGRGAQGDAAAEAMGWDGMGRNPIKNRDLNGKITYKHR